MMGNPLGPGGYGSFLENFLKRGRERRKKISKKKREGKLMRRECIGDAMAGCWESV